VFDLNAWRDEMGERFQDADAECGIEKDPGSAFQISGRGFI